MSEEVVQWLEEIRGLQAQLAEAQRDRDAAQASADHWRSMYNTEARQRRDDVQAAQAAQSAMEQKLTQLQQPPSRSADTPKLATFAAELAPLKTESQLRNKLIELLDERDRTRSALKKEQENHRQTRQNLTAVIGDTMDQLMRLRGTPPATHDSNSDVHPSKSIPTDTGLTVEVLPPSIPPMSPEP